jgi:hypothetical protein
LDLAYSSATLLGLRLLTAMNATGLSVKSLRSLFQPGIWETQVGHWSEKK